MTIWTGLALSLAAAATTATPSPTPGTPLSQAELLLRPPKMLPAAAIASARGALGLAVAELDGCCRGELEAAPLETQRRWASSLYRWLVLSECKPDPSGFEAKDRFEAQAARLEAEYVARVAVHDSSWLEQNRASLGRAVAEPGRSVRRLFEGVCVLGVFEQELRRAIDKRDAVTKAADAELEARRRSVAEDQIWAREQLGKARQSDVDFDYGKAFEQQRARLNGEIKLLEGKIKVIQDEDADYQMKWQEKYGRLAYGTFEFQRAIGEYRRVVNEHNDQIVALSKQITELQQRIDRYQSGALRQDIDEVAMPAPAKVIGVAPAGANSLPAEPPGATGSRPTTPTGAPAAATPTPLERP